MVDLGSRWQNDVNILDLLPEIGAFYIDFSRLISAVSSYCEPNPIPNTANLRLRWISNDCGLALRPSMDDSS